MIEVSKIVVKIGDKEATLTLKEARGLRDVLDGLFGKEAVLIPWTYPSTAPLVPYWPTLPVWTVTYAADTTNISNAVQ